VAKAALAEKVNIARKADDLHVQVLELDACAARCDSLLQLADVIDRPLQAMIYRPIPIEPHEALGGIPPRKLKQSYAS
jgi:hypothetical protein